MVWFLSLIAPLAPAGKTGRPPFATEVMLRIYLLQQFFGHSDPAMEEALHDIPLHQEFARLGAGMTRLPDESTILRFRHLLEAHARGMATDPATVNAKLIGWIDRSLMLKTGTVVDATMIAAPSLPRMTRARHRDAPNQEGQPVAFWHEGPTSVWMLSGAGTHDHNGQCTRHDASPALLHGEEDVVFADSGYRGLAKNTYRLQRCLRLSTR